MDSPKEPLSVDTSEETMETHMENNKKKVLVNIDQLLDAEKDLLDSDSEGDYSSYVESLMTSTLDVTSSNDDGNKEKAPEEKGTIARKENEAVMAIKIVVMGVLTMSMIGIACLVYFYVSSEEKRNFELAFEDRAFTVLSSLSIDLTQALYAMDALVFSMLSSVASTGTSWPYETVPDAATLMSKSRSLSKALVIEQFQFVNDDNRRMYEDYAFANKGWVDEAIRMTQEDPSFHGLKNVTEYNTSASIFYAEEPLPANSGPYTPTWQSFPVVPLTPPYNMDVSKDINVGSGIEKSTKAREVVITKVLNFMDPEDTVSEETSLSVNEWASRFVGPNTDPSEPLVKVLFPMIDSALDMDAYTEEAGSVVGTMAMSFYWSTLLGDFDLLPSELHLVVVIENGCNQTFTYQIDGGNTSYLGQGDLHESDYDDFMILTTIEELGNYSDSKESYTGPRFADDFCPYSFRIYPSETMEKEYLTSEPFIFTAAVICVFLFTSATFTLYDMIVSIKQEKIIETAEKSNAIVSSLFPSNVRDRLFDEEKKTDSLPTKARMKNFLSDSNRKESQTQGETDGTSRPIADLFPETTVMFADIAGFTAWSSVREPSQVFCLLETLYGAFDTIAVKRGVFKVETIGDSYVAVTGLPEPRKDHAIVMVKFAKDCRSTFADITRDLEVTLGPDTCDLKLRFGLHSGPVTAGVLRGQKSRFQLFGDTVNTASRMESTGMSNRIQISQATADILIMARKGSWLHPRSETIEVKGKGMMQTYWVEPAGTVASSNGGSSIEESMTNRSDHRQDRLVDWNTDIMGRILRLIVSRREACGEMITSNGSVGDSSQSSGGTMPIDEVKEVIELPDFARSFQGTNIVELDPDVKSELHEYVAAIADTYRENPFHNFEHASHVGMSVAKLLSRIVAPDLPILNNTNHNDMELSLHDHTYGITSDPLTQFACVFAALIHDVDHQGVSNDQLVKEEASVALQYNGKSVAEQNSIDIAWNIFKSPKYSKLRNAICPTQAELTRFRELVVNSVLATDIMDKDLKKLRNERWETAFSESSGHAESERRNRNRKATIVIEHLIQASDVAHTMQHWHVYRKWNERLFFEMSSAYQAGRFVKDPAEFWYEGEMGFFDFYIIPLAKKLSDCGVFGVSSDEYLNYAMRNREEWERTGKEIVADMVMKRENKDALSHSMRKSSLSHSTRSH